MNIKVLFSLFAIIYSFNSHSQSLNWSTIFQNLVGSGNFISHTDDNGNIYSVGRWDDSVYVQNTNYPFRQMVNGRNQLFICKQNKSGQMIWFKNVGNVYSTEPLGLRIDHSGNPIIFGNFEGPLDFDPDTGVFNLFAFGSPVLFVLKLDTGGVFKWAQKIEGIEIVNDNMIDIDQNDNIYVSCRPRNTNDYDGSPTTTQLRTADFGFVLFSWDKNGTFRWAHPFDTYQYAASVSALDIDPVTQDIVLIGEFEGSYDFDPSSSTVIKTSSGYRSFFILKLDTLGQFKWVKVLNSTRTTFPGNLFLNTLEVDNYGSVIITGKFSETIDFDPSSSSNTLTAPTFTTLEYLLKLDRNGLFKWVKNFDSDDINVHSSTSDPLGGIYLAGYYLNTVDLDLGPGVNNVVSSGVSDGFFVRLDSMGNFYSSGTVGGVQSDGISHIEVDKEFNLHVFGTFSSSADLDPSSGIQNFTVLYRGYTWYYLKLFQCIETYSSINANTCDTYTSPSLKKVWNASGVYKDTLVNFIDCDSIITVNLIVDTVDITTNVNNNSITANASNATFRWLDCANNYTVIPNQITNIFTAISSGIYAVEVTQNSCVDTSVCQPIVVTQIDNNQLLNALFISPNPTKGVVNVSLNTNYDRLWVSDISGRIVYKIDQENGSMFSIDLTQYENGIYFLNLEIEGERIVRKVVKY